MATSSGFDKIDMSLGNFIRRKTDGRLFLCLDEIITAQRKEKRREAAQKRGRGRGGRGTRGGQRGGTTRGRGGRGGRARVIATTRGRGRGQSSVVSSCIRGYLFEKR